MPVSLFPSPPRILLLSDRLSPCQHFTESSPAAVHMSGGSLHGSLGRLVPSSFAEALPQKCEASRWPSTGWAVCLIWPPLALGSWAWKEFLVLGMGLGRIWLQGMRQVCVC